MKYILALILGLLVGGALFAVGATYNPFVGKQGLSPLAVSKSQVVVLSYSANASEGILFTNDGKSRVDPHPEKVLQLWEQSIRQTTAMATTLRDARNQVAGVGIKFASLSEKTRLISGEALVDSVWYVYLPGRGGVFIEQTENYWSYFRDVVVPAYRSSSDTWTGVWHGSMTSGPGALRTAKVSGAYGEFEGSEMLGVESLSIRAWRVDSGVVAAEGQLLIELQDDRVVEAVE